jgi:hypothetical protein
LAKSGLKRAKIGEELLSILKFFHSPSTFNKCKQNHSTSENMNGSCQVFANSQWAILPPLLLADSGYLAISQRLSYTLSELPIRFPMACGHFTEAFLYPFRVPSA